MINSLSGVLLRGNNIRNGIFIAKKLFNPTSVQLNSNSLKLFSGGVVRHHQQRNEGALGPERQLPTLVYIQNPITWLINKIDFKMLKTAWDADFAEEEFKRGTKQAVSIICTLISKTLWDNLRGLVTRQALARLRRDVEINWSKELLKNMAIQPSDIKLTLPRKVHFLRVADQKFVDVDMMCVAMKFKEQQPSLKTDIILIEIMARFHRNYSAGQLPNWTVTLFKFQESVHNYGVKFYPGGLEGPTLGSKDGTKIKLCNTFHKLWVETIVTAADFDMVDLI